MLAMAAMACDKADRPGLRTRPRRAAKPRPAPGIALDNQNDAGATCLMYAASSGRAEMVGWLLAAGADPDLKNQDDARAVDLCATLRCLRLLRAVERSRA
jgi:ankyrin repeat protein